MQFGVVYIAVQLQPNTKPMGFSLYFCCFVAAHCRGCTQRRRVVADLWGGYKPPRQCSTLWLLCDYQAHGHVTAADALRHDSCRAAQCPLPQHVGQSECGQYACGYCGTRATVKVGPSQSGYTWKGESEAIAAALNSAACSEPMNFGMLNLSNF